MSKIKNLIVHCSASSWGDVSVIRDWHLARGWKNVGYNAIITNGRINYEDEYNIENDGILQKGRELDFDGMIDSDERAAHALGYNHNSVGVCLIGRDTFTVKQFETLIHFCKVFQAISPGINIMGHYECSGTKKTCPNIDMEAFRAILNVDDNIVNLIRENLNVG